MSCNDMNFVLQLKATEQQHEQISGSPRVAAMASLREKEAAMQASALQLFNKRLHLIKESNSLEVTLPSDTTVLFR